MIKVLSPKEIRDIADSRFEVIVEDLQEELKNNAHQLGKTDCNIIDIDYHVPLQFQKRISELFLNAGWSKVIFFSNGERISFITEN